MNRRRSTNPAPTSSSSIQSILACVTSALIGGVLATSVLITGDSVSISSGESLPQVLLILFTALVAGLAGWQVWPWRRDQLFPAVLLSLSVVVLVISCLSASSHADGRPAWNNFWHWLALLVYAMLASRLAQSPGLSRVLFQAVLLCALFQTTFALHQYLVSMPAARAEYLADPDAALLKAKIDAPPGSELRTQFENRILNSFEPLGTFALTNSLAVLLSGVIVAWGSVLVQRGMGADWRLWSVRAVWLAVIGVWLLTKSRSGYLAVISVGAVTYAVVVWHQRSAGQVNQTSTMSKPTGRRLGWVIGAVCTLAIVGAMIILLAQDRLVLSEAPKSILYRLEYWQAASKMIVDHPWTGVGPGNFQSYYAAYKLPQASEMIADPHNWLFDLAANASVPLLILAILGLAWAARSGFANIPLGDQQADESRESNQANASTRLSGAFWIGALLALLLTAVLQLLFGQLIDFDATGLAIMASVGGWWLLRGWVIPLSALRRGALLAVITMLVSLLASGCWQASGIALPMAVCLGIVCPGTVYPGRQPAGAAPQKRPDGWSMAGLATTLVALAGFLVQTWQPVQTSWALQQQALFAWQQGKVPMAVDLMRQATEADSIASSPKRMLAEFAMQRAADTARSASEAQFAPAAEELDISLQALLASDPISSLNHSFAGECNLTLAASCATWSESITVRRMQLAADNYRRAHERYPTNIATLVQLAVIQAWLARAHAPDPSSPESVQNLLSEAYRLNDVTPHTNRKLAAQQIFLPPTLARLFDAAAVVRPSPDSPWVQAEPLAEHLRKQ